MPITIGAKQESSFSDPIGLLGDCHRRIERFLSVLLTVVEQAHGTQMNRDQHSALETALRYFRESAPRHIADEEETLFPRLIRLAHPSVAVLAQIDALEEDHGLATKHHQEVDHLGGRWLDEGCLDTRDLERLTNALRTLATLYGTHIKTEESVVFPLAAQVLSDSEMAAVGREMAARRGVEGRMANDALL